MQNLLQEYSVSAQYFAPRGKDRLIFLGEQIAQKHLMYSDRLIGIVGDAGSGKSSLIKGMFPGLELSNDDDVINPRKIMQARDFITDGIGDAYTYHLDIRFQMAFTQMSEIVDYVREILNQGRRAVIEHFNLIYPYLGENADIIIGIGEEIIVTRPSVFGPSPSCIYDIVHTSLKYRKMSHTAEELTALALISECGITLNQFYSSDIRYGFVLRFYENVDIDFEKVSNKVKELIKADLDVSYVDEKHIRIGDITVKCTGPRLHMTSTGQIEDFELINRLVPDPKSNSYCLVGLIGNNNTDIENRNTTYFLKRD
ncbi:alanine-tRNA synthetase second additional domain-containing protein [Porphyromonas pogonae]|uniref:alanine-tRNA synthetase second additional domain-containing protein n=1 Tax=Porphyromonas pogonae TaxID=867595 RepID=UPI002E75F891|nr:alanine-tRNA synthetase second additional domain-containing protein [Porphyromonas pogonae]